MGSSRRSKSSRAGKASPAKPTNREIAKNDIYEALHQFSEALAIVETVSRALHAAESDLECRTIGAEIATLRQGVRALVSAHQEIDKAIPGVAS
jgi:hypothetical protein